ncbi:hypothetical protein FO519_004941 [Halicephalobus sp. NKZ332]|nr:hypothetical protein FO519_004941 [Halicephalobus sp. NKZ332]
MAVDPLKTIVIGEANCGKSWLISSFLGKDDLNSVGTTIGVEFHSRQIEIDGKSVAVQLWDTAGQDKFRAVVPQFYKRARAIALVYDVTRYESFRKIEAWFEEAQRYIEKYYTVMLIGNKMDLTEERQVPTEEGYNYAKTKGFFFMETSALQETNVEPAFMELVQQSYRQWKRMEVVSEKASDVITVEEQPVNKKRAHFWDTGGQERFDSVMPLYYRGANAVILAYDVTSHFSFVRIKEYWMQQARQYTGEDCVLMLVGTKIDLQKRREVTSVEAMEYAREYKCFLAETSALKNINVQSTFKKIVEETYKRKLDTEHKRTSEAIEAIRISSAPPVEETKSSCRC